MLEPPRTRPRVAAPADTPGVVEALADHARHRPDAEAVVCAGRTLTFADLDDRSSQLARAIRDRGVGPGALVGVALERSVELLVALVAVQKSGAAYVPVDPAYPRERNGLILDDAQVALVLSMAPLAPALPPPTAPVLRLDRDWEAITALPEAPLPAAAADGELAYVIYTSGSTGRPKGVMIEHGGLRNLLAAMATTPGLAPGETMLGVTTPAFDLSVPDLYLPLLTGARLVLATRAEAGDPRALQALLETHEVSLMQATPSTWRMLIDAGWPGRGTLRVVSGGEELPGTLATSLAGRVETLWNFYGPTEATVWTTCARIGRDGRVSLGDPLPRTTCLLLDDDGEPVADGDAGELWIGGVGVARGYHNLPELSAERFVPDRFTGGGRLYRTGDRARRSPEGELEFLGRADLQVKLHGYRIELGEIEAILARHDDVAQAAVALRSDPRGEPAIVAYAVARPDRGLTATALRRFARELLPAYMVPAAVVPVAALPTTPNGKLDRAALPDPEPGAFGAASALVAPRSPLESRLLGVWRQVLGVEAIGVTDDFFDLGVDSLTAARLFARMEHELHRQLPLSALFEAPTVERLAELLEREGAGRPRWSSLVRMRAGGARPLLVCVHGGAGTVLFYEELVRRLGDEQPVVAFQAAGLYGHEAPHTSVPQMARAYVEELSRAGHPGPYVLAGYCYGGMVAYEMAQQLRARGREVLLLVMLNAPSPTYNDAYKPVFDEAGPVTDRRGQLRNPEPARDASMGASLRRQWSAAQGGPALRARKVGEAAVRRARVLAQARLRRLQFVAAVRLRRPLPDALRESRTFGAIAARAQRAYRPEPYEGPMLVFRSRGLYYEDDLGWRAFVRGPIECHEVPGLQATPRDAMREPAVGFVARHLEAASLRASPGPGPASTTGDHAAG